MGSYKYKMHLNLSFNPFPGDILTTLFPVTGCVTPVYFLWIKRVTGCVTPVYILWRKIGPSDWLSEWLNFVGARVISLCLGQSDFPLLRPEWLPFVYSMLLRLPCLEVPGSWRELELAVSGRGENFYGEYKVVGKNFNGKCQVVGGNFNGECQVVGGNFNGECQVVEENF